MSFEISIKIIDNEYIDPLILSLVHQGYSVYFNKEEEVVCFSATEEEVTEIKRRG